MKSGWLSPCTLSMPPTSIKSRALSPGHALYLSFHLLPALSLSTRPPRALPFPAPAPHPRPALARSPRSRARPLRARSVPVPCPLRARFVLAPRSLAFPRAGCGGSRSARSWRSAGAAAGGRVQRAPAPSMSRRRLGPRAARGPTAARGLRGSYAGPDRGRQRAQILSPSVPPSLPRAVPSGRGRGRGVRGHRVPPGVTVAGQGHRLPARVMGRACRRACGSPARSCRELRPGLDSAGTPRPQRLRGTGRSLPGRGGSALGRRAWARAGRSAAPGLA